MNQSTTNDIGDPSFQLEVWLGVGCFVSSTFHILVRFQCMFGVGCEDCNGNHFMLVH